jgi:hypothetical protein
MSIASATNGRIAQALRVGSLGRDDLPAGVELARDQQHELPDLRIVDPAALELALDERVGVADGPERIAKLVADAGGELADGGELLQPGRGLGCVLERDLLLAVLVELTVAFHTIVDEEDVDEDDPAGVLEEAPPLRVADPIDRLRPYDASAEVIGGDQQRRGDQQLGVAIEGQERERPEDVKVRLDASTGQVDEQR